MALGLVRNTVAGNACPIPGPMASPKFPEMSPVPGASPFDLEATLDSGQVFHWLPSGEGWWCGCIGDRLVRVRAAAAGIGVEPAESGELVRRYFRLDEDHPGILASFPRDDPALAEAVAYCPGLRIIRQPPWECLATFLTSSLKQVAHIRQISLRVRRELGERHVLGEAEGFSYPAPEVLAKAGEPRLRELGLGYRASFVLRAAQRLAAGEIDLEDGTNLGDEDLLGFLLRFDGVGEKIANCVRLFGYGRLAAFPVDVWIERVLRERYFGGRSVSRKELGKFVVHHFGAYGGYAQQFLFHHARTSRGKSRSRP